MKMDKIMKLIRELAKSQGFYGRLYERLIELKENAPEAYEKVKKYWEDKNFKDPLDFILYIEE